MKMSRWKQTITRYQWSGFIERLAQERLRKSTAKYRHDVLITVDSADGLIRGSRRPARIYGRQQRLWACNFAPTVRQQVQVYGLVRKKIRVEANTREDVSPVFCRKKQRLRGASNL